MDRGRPAVTQTAVAPCVYLDQWAYHLLVKESQQLRRFATALTQSGGTLAFSLVNFNEISQISVLAQIQQIENLFEQIWPHVVFIESNPIAVISNEDKILQGIRNSPPHLDDDWLLKIFANFPRGGINPLDARGFLLQLRNPGVPQGFQTAFQALRKRMQSAFVRSKSRYETDQTAKKEVHSRLRGTVHQSPTRYILKQTLYGAIKNNLNTDNLNNISDLLHMIVPLSYCNIVLLDKQWAERARQVQKSVRDARLLTYEAEVYSQKDMGTFWSSMENLAASKAIPRPTQATR